MNAYNVMHVPISHVLYNIMNNNNYGELKLMKFVSCWESGLYSVLT